MDATMNPRSSKDKNGLGLGILWAARRLGTLFLWSARKAGLLFLWIIRKLAHLISLSAQRFGVGKTALAMLLAILMIYVAIEAPEYPPDSGGGSGPSTDSSARPAPEKFDPRTLLPGATVQLRSDSGGEVPVVLTRDAYNQWMKLAEANDTLGEEKMGADGEMLLAPSGTRGRILESHDSIWNGDGSYNLRILDGPLYAESVWTNRAFVKEDKPAVSSGQPSSGRDVCPTCPAPGTHVVIKFSGDSKTTELIQGFANRDAYRRVVVNSNVGSVVKLIGDAARSGEEIGIPNGTLAEVVKSARFSSDPSDAPERDGIYIRILGGTCHDVSGYRDCRGRKLWVDSVFISSANTSEPDKTPPYADNKSPSTPDADMQNRPSAYPQPPSYKEEEAIACTKVVQGIRRWDSAGANSEGLRLLAASNLEGARGCFQFAVGLDGSNVEALNNLGYVSQLQGRFRESENYLLKVIQLAPDRKVAYGNLGYTEAKLGKHAEAVSCFRKYISLFHEEEHGKAALKRAITDDDPRIQSALQEALSQ